MMEKYSDFSFKSGDEEVFKLLTPGEKLAGLEQYADQYDPEVQEFLNRLTPNPRFTYALINAMGAGEAVGSNRNGDYFPEEALREYHPTFVQHAKVYQHHVNKDPRKKLGDVLFSHYNQKMRRVELVVQLDKEIEAAKKVIQRLLSGDKIMTSMGCRVPEDFCSITGKAQKTRADYSDWCRNRMGEILPDGRKIYAINKRPNFFDISVVLIPADRTAYIMGHYDGEEKKSSLVKRIPAHMETLMDRNSVIYNSQPPLPEEVIKELQQAKLNEALSTLLAARIIPKPEEFSRIVTASYGEEAVLPIDVKLEEMFIPEDIGPEFTNHQLGEKLAAIAEDYSLIQPYVIQRTVKLAQPNSLYPNKQPVPERSWISKVLFQEPDEPKTSPSKNPAPAMVGLSALYAGYLHLFGQTSGSGFSAYLAKNPWVIPIVAGGVGLASYMAQEKQFNPPLVDSPTSPSPEEKVASLQRFGMGMLIATPTSYYLAGKAENDARRGKQLSSTENLVRKYPFLTALTTAGVGTGVLTKLKGRGLKPGMFKSAEEVFLDLIA